MMSLFKKQIVVMDSSNFDTLNGISGVIAMMTQGRSKLTCRKLDANHPTMKVIEFKARRKCYNQIQDVIEKCWPGLCTFDPVI